MPRIHYTRFPEAPRRQGTCQLISSLLFWGQPVETDTCMYVCMYVERHKPQVCFQSESPLSTKSTELLIIIIIIIIISLFIQQTIQYVTIKANTIAAELKQE